MPGFISRKKIYRKLITILSILLIMGAGLYFFDLKKDDFKGVFFKAYDVMALSFYNLNKINGGLNASSAFANDPEINQAISSFNQSQPDKNANSVPVLLYHGIVEKADGANVTYENFRNQMLALKRAGYQTISIDEFYKFIKNEEKIPDKSFLLTFDDGRKDSYYPVDPLLKSLDYKAVMFVIDGEVNSNNPFYLNETELKNMENSGRWEIQSHGFKDHGLITVDAKGNQGHFFDNKQWLPDKNRLETDEEFQNRIYNDLATADKQLQKDFNLNFVSFAIPFGDFGQDSINYPNAKSVVTKIMASVYKLAFYQSALGSDFSQNYPANDTFLIKRIHVFPDWTDTDLLNIIDNGKVKLLPLQDDFSANLGWITDWGEARVKNNFLDIKADNSNGSITFLDGSYAWKNYSFDANIFPIKGNSISLLARFQNKYNYAECTFSKNAAVINQIINSQQQELSKNKVSWNQNQLVNLKITVKNNFIECYLNGELIVESQINPALNYGGIAFKVWDPQINNAEISVKSATVKKL